MLVVLVVATGLIAPRLNGSLSRREVREAAGEFAATARTVRELAISNGRIVSIQIDLDARIRDRDAGEHGEIDRPEGHTDVVASGGKLAGVGPAGVRAHARRQHAVGRHAPRGFQSRRHQQAVPPFDWLVMSRARFTR